MRATIVLAEAASMHPDGTMSLLRAWINHVVGTQPPYLLRGAIAVRIEAELGDAGSHTFDLKCLDVDGAEVLPTLEGDFEVAKSGGVSMFVLGIQAPFSKPGKYVFVLRVDRVQLGDWALTVDKIDQPSS